MEIKTTLVSDSTGSTTVKSQLHNKIDKWTDGQRANLLYLRLHQGLNWEEIGKELKRKPSACQSMFTYAKLQHTIEELRQTNNNWASYGEIAERRIYDLKKKVDELEAKLA